MGDGGYRPARVEVAAGECVRLRFVRRDYGGCTREVVFPTLGLRRELPTGRPVTVALPALPALPVHKAQLALSAQQVQVYKAQQALPVLTEQQAP